METEYADTRLGGNAQQASRLAPPPSGFAAEVQDRLGQLGKTLYAARNELDNLSDRLFGAEPSAAGSNAERPQSTASCMRVHDSISDLQDLANGIRIRAEALAARL